MLDKLARNAFTLDRVQTPIGTMLLVSDDDGCLRAADFHDYEDRMHRLLRLNYPSGGYSLREARTPAPIREHLEAYFAGRLDAIDQIDVKTGGTAFQQKVWRALRDIGAGRTETYGRLAARIGAIKAVRAVGAANGANPVGVIVPCHRVIGANGDLTGYGGGIDRKRWLLRHEGAAFKDGTARLPGL
ncbi:methylated-DNA--[protein]-cysteine S-methyltransferase [Bradyrhizobium sp. LHD-71]|uniref:methylated-DNA--[protein]-cysteine S-methyltransferase n=1 Tax=Bradyrhizobium sp. LHD-71 TaxID=3072141 RepID=UPI00280F96F0|nr:methylated-DNA--[protein]-cysteine S-methyltransferase [Bradyrhizobium sp. LHD-71]MDQ8730187.1 methylated-DNA--[protein]-cysteine S-methyltransferase [Bradyrhizobium sp. LHD-71]